MTREACRHGGTASNTNSVYSSGIARVLDAAARPRKPLPGNFYPENFFPTL
jgi:hypothetical protein